MVYRCIDLEDGFHLYVPCILPSMIGVNSNNVSGTRLIDSVEYVFARIATRTCRSVLIGNLFDYLCVSFGYRKKEEIVYVDKNKIK